MKTVDECLTWRLMTTNHARLWRAQFCRVCADALKRDKPFILMCQACEIDYDDAMSEHDDFDGSGKNDSKKSNRTTDAKKH